MNRFTYDLLHDRTEDNQVIEEQELVRRMSIPAYASDEQRKELMLWMMDAIDEVSLTSQRLEVEWCKGSVTVRRLLGGGYDPIKHGDAFAMPSSFTQETANGEN
jgi:hypothetical protein